MRPAVEGYSYKLWLYTVLVSRCSGGISVELMLYFTGATIGLASQSDLAL